MQSKVIFQRLLFVITFQILYVPLIARSSHVPRANPEERQSSNCPEAFQDHLCLCPSHSITCYPNEGAIPFTAFPVSNEIYPEITLM